MIGNQDSIDPKKGDTNIDPKTYCTSILRDHIMKKKKQQCKAMKISVIIEEKMTTESENLHSNKITPQRLHNKAKNAQKFSFNEGEPDSKSPSIIGHMRSTPRKTPHNLRPESRQFTFREESQNPTPDREDREPIPRKDSAGQGTR
jgi:hypothetical protein